MFYYFRAKYAENYLLGAKYCADFHHFQRISPNYCDDSLNFNLVTPACQISSWTNSVVHGKVSQKLMNITSIIVPFDQCQNLPDKLLQNSRNTFIFLTGPILFTADFPLVSFKLCIVIPTSGKTLKNNMVRIFFVCSTQYCIVGYRMLTGF